MQNICRGFLSNLVKMANLPPRKAFASSKAKQDASPLQILLQMGFPRHRALKALAATGNRSVQLASDWLLTHVNDTQIDDDEPREYIFYASPTGSLLNQLLNFWEKSKSMAGWNGAHNFPPHITLVSFFKAPDETSLQLAKAVKHVVETVGELPNSPLKLEPYVSHNFMGLFVSEEHADYLKRIAVQYVKQVSSVLGVMVDTYEHLDALGACFPWCTMQQEKPIKSINLEAHVKSLHITLAYHFEKGAYDGLKSLVDELQPSNHSSWELRLYSRDPRFAKHQVHKVIQGYSPKASDELELVLGDYIYIEEKEFDNSPDGWVHGTSWLTGSDSKSESDSNIDGEMAASFPHEDATQLGHDKSEETYKEWHKYWEEKNWSKVDSIMDMTQGSPIDWKLNTVEENGDVAAKSSDDKKRRWIFVMRHGERVDLTYGQWVPYCFDENGKYVRKDLNMPLKLGEREGGKNSYYKDTPLTRVGRLQAQLVGEGLRLAGYTVQHVYASAALRCVETAQAFLDGLQADPSIKIKVEPGLFEYKMWHQGIGLAPFMTNVELHKAGLNVDLNYQPYIDLDINTPETFEDYYKRGELIVQSVVKETEKEGANVIFVGHAATLDATKTALKRLDQNKTDYPPYQITNNLLRVPYCAFGALRDKPWEVVCPPCPPSINSSSARFDWRILVDPEDNDV